MKKNTNLSIYGFLLLTIIGLAFSCGPKTQEEKTTTPAQSYKMTTKIPEGIAIPDQIDSRIGTLNFFDGFPDSATVDKLYDNLDFQRAVQAYLLGLAPVSQYANRKGILEVGPANLTVPIFEDIMNARSLFLTPNNNTPYIWFWLDLKDGPLVMEIPPRVLGLIDDMWYKFVTDLGFMGPDKGEGGKYLLLPPNYKGEIPKGYHVVQSPTYSIWVAWRTFLVDGDTKPEVENVKKLTKIYPLSQIGNPPSLNFVNVSDKDFNSIAPADYTFWEYLDKVVQEEPTETVNPVTLGYWASIGIRKGQPFNPDERMKKILTEAALVGDATARAVSYKSREKDAYFYPNSAWCNPMNASGYTFEKDGVSLLDMNTFFFFYATGITPAMDSKVVGQGSQYMAAFVDSKGKGLDGGKNYKLHLPPNIPVANFWSVILYDNQTRSMLQNDQKWPAVTSQSKETLINPDGSVDIYFGPKPPEGKENNWVQTIPGKGWNTLLRIYGPLQPWFDKTWRPGEIEEVK